MGGAQSAQREDKDSAAEESGGADDAQPEQHAEDKSLKNNGQISEISGKADATVAGINRHCEEEVAAEAIVSPDEDVSAAEKPLKETNEHESPNEADANEEVTLETIEMDAKHNDINDSFRRLFSNINLKVTVKRGSAEKDDMAADVSDDATKEESTRPEGPAETAKEDTSENAEINTEQEPCDHDSTCPTLTDIKSEDVEEEKTTETKGEAYCENAGLTERAPNDESVQQTATSEGDMVVSPVKRFFTTGIFSGLRKKKKSVDETAEKELVDMSKAEVIETTEDREVSPSEETDAVQTQHKENGLKDEVLSAKPSLTVDEGKPPSTDPSAIIVNEPEIISSQEKDKVQASPLKRLLSGSSFKKPSKKQRERKSSEAKLSDSGEYVSHQLPPSTDAPENQKGESPAGEEDGAWASFKKLMTPKKRMKRSSLTNEETQTSGLAQESKSSEGEQMSDNSTEENKKRKDSSVSWEAVLCGSGRRRSRSRSRKTSDSEDEKPQEESDNKKKESPLESSNEIDKSPTTEGDGGSTWRSIKKLVTPKRKAKDEDLQSDGEATQEDSSFSIKKLLPGQKKRKPAEKQDYVSSDEADKEVASCDEDSDTPAVVPLSEFDAVDTGVLETHADVESHTSLEADYKLQEDPDKTTEPGESLQSEAKPVQDKENALENEAPTAPALDEEPDEITELISKHQQLSDIPEEGIITETMVTPGSFPEQPARDDTIAEDLIEITSEAITAPEPVDVTMADDTEMISAVSQLSDSSKTSGNTTPVPVEYDVKDTEVLLQQVAENISASPKADPLCSDEISSERIIASVSCQILESFVKQQPTILEIHRRSDATAFKTGLNVKVLDEIQEHAATAQTESIAEVNEAVYTEIVSEVTTELDAAESTMDDIHEVSVTQTEKSIELESARANKSQDLTKYQAQYEASTEKLSEGEETVECSMVEAHRAETETLQTEFIDGAVTQEVQTLLEAHEIVQTLTDQLQAEHQDQSPVEVVQELQELAAAERDTSDSERDIVEPPGNTVPEDVPSVEEVTGQLKDVELEKEDKAPAALDSDNSGIQICEKQVALPEDAPTAETVTDTPEPFPEVHVEPEKEDELQTDAAKTEHEVSAAHDATLDTETQTSHSIQTKEEVTDQCKELPESLTETDVESEKEEQADSAKTEDGQEPEVHNIQDPAADPQIRSIQIIEKEELLSVEIKAELEVTDEPKGQPESLLKLNTNLTMKNELQAECEHGAAPEVLDGQTNFRDSEKDDIQSLKKKALVSEETPPAETVTDEQDQPESLMQGNVELEREDGQQSEILEEQATALLSQMGTTYASEKEVTLSKDMKAEEAVTDEPREEREPVSEAHVDTEKNNNLQAHAVKSDHEQDPGVLDVKETALVSEGSIQTPGGKTLSEDIEPEEGGTDDLHTEVNAEPENEYKLQAEDVPPGQTVTDEPKEESEMVTEINMELEQKELQADVAKPDHEQDPDVLDVKETALVSEGIIQTAGGKVPLSEDVPPGETVIEEPQEEPVTEINMELERKELQADAVKSDHEQDPDVLVKGTALVSEGSIQTAGGKVPLSEDVPPGETVIEEPQEEPVTEINMDLEQKVLQSDAAKPEQVSEIFRGEEETIIDEQIGTIQISEKEVPLSEHIKPEGRVTDDHHTKANAEPENEYEVQTEDVLPGETEEPQEESELITEINMEIELQADAAKPEQVSEIFKGVEETVIDEQIGTIQISAKEVPLSEDVPPGVTVMDEPKEESVTEINIELEQKELQADAVKPEQVSVSEQIFRGEEETVIDEQIGTIQIPEKELPLSEDVLLGETVREGPKEESVTEINIELEKKELQADAVKHDHEQDPDVLVKETAVLSEGSIQPPGGKILLDNIEPEEGGTDDSHTKANAEPENKHKFQAQDVPPGETDEPKEESEPVNKINMELEQKELQADAAKSEQVSVSEQIFRGEEETVIDEQTGTIQIPEKELPLSEDGPPGETVREGPKEEPVTEIKMELEKKELQADAVKSDHEQDPDVLVKGTALVSESSIRTVGCKVPLSEDIEPEEGGTDDSHTKANAEPENNSKLQVEDVPPGETVTEEPKEESETVTEINMELEQKELQADAVKPEQVSEIFKGEEETVIGIKIGTIQISAKEVPLSEDVPPGETVTEELKEESKTVTKINMELEQKELQADVVKSDHEQDADVLDVKETALVSEGSIQTAGGKVPLPEEVPPGETVTEEPQKEPVTEINMELDNEPKEKDQLHADVLNTEHGQVIEIVEDNTSVVESHTHSFQIPEREAPLSEKCEPDKAESRDEGDPVTQVYVESEEKVELQAAEIEEHTSAPVSHAPPSSEDFKPEEAVTDELKEESESATKFHTEPENENELHEDEHEQDAKALVVQKAARDSEMANIQTPESKSSGDIQPTEAVSKDTAEHLTVSTASTKDEIRKPLVEDDQRTLASEIAQVSTTDIDEINSISEATAESQTLTDKPKKETDPLTEVEQLVLQEGSVESEDTSGAVIDKLTQATEGNTELEVERPGGGSKTEHVQVLPCDVRDTVTETETSASGCVTEMAERVTAQELNSLGMDDALASAKDEPEDEAGDVNQDQTPEISPQDGQLEEEHSVPEVVGTFQTLSAVHVSSVTEEKNRAHILEKTVIPEKNPAPCLDHARDTYEPKHQVHLSEVRGLVERERQGELPGLEVKTSTVEHAVVAQVTTCNLREVSPAMPDVLTEEPSNVCEPSVEMVVGELELKKEAENAKPLVQNDESETATEGNVVVTMHVSSAEFGDNHRIQVQVADVDMKSAGMNVDSALEVGVTETKEAVDVCHESIEVTEKLLATETTEEELMDGEHQAIHHRVIQHVKENLPEIEVDQTSCQDESVSLEHKQLNGTEMSEMGENKSHEADQPATDSSRTVGKNEATEAEQLVAEAICDHKEVVEEPKKYEEVKSPSEGLEIRGMNQEAQNKQGLLSQTVTVSNTGLEVPQNSGVISSIGNLDAPSSLSLELKLNIQFGKSKTPATERTEPVKQSSVSEVGIQAVEPINGVHENNKKPEMHDVTVQATEITEPEHVNPSTAERAVIMKQPVLLDIGIQSVEAAQPVEQIKSTERLNPSELETEKIKAVMKAKTFLSQPVLYEACYEEITVEEPVKQIEEENEQDLWVDAEEHVQTQEESRVSLVKEEEPVAPHPESEEEEKAEVEHEFEMAPETAPKAKTEEEEGEKEARETENETEEFAVALEHPEAAKTAPTD